MSVVSPFLMLCEEESKGKEISEPFFRCLISFPPFGLFLTLEKQDYDLLFLMMWKGKGRWTTSLFLLWFEPSFHFLLLLSSSRLLTSLCDNREGQAQEKKGIMKRYGKIRAVFPTVVFKIMKHSSSFLSFIILWSMGSRGRDWLSDSSPDHRSTSQ